MIIVKLMQKIVGMMKIKLVFKNWHVRAFDIDKQLDLDIMLSDFHGGSTFDAEIELDEEQELILKDALEAGCTPDFWIAKD